MTWQNESEIKYYRNEDKYTRPAEITRKVNIETGLVKMRRFLNKFHKKLESAGFNQVMKRLDRFLSIKIPLLL